MTMQGAKNIAEILLLP